MPQKIRRVYVDSSVVGGAFNKRIAEETRPFWDAVRRGEIIVILSDVLDDELKSAPNRAKKLVDDLPVSQIERVLSTEESDALAGQYLDENVVGESSFFDCKHVALATIAYADVLVSWNMKHMVHIDRKRGYNSVNLKLGYPQIEILTPNLVVYVES